MEAFPASSHTTSVSAGPVAKMLALWSPRPIVSPDGSALSLIPAWTLKHEARELCRCEGWEMAGLAGALMALLDELTERALPASPSVFAH